MGDGGLAGGVELHVPAGDEAAEGVGDEIDPARPGLPLDALDVRGEFTGEELVDGPMGVVSEGEQLGVGVSVGLEVRPQAAPDAGVGVVAVDEHDGGTGGRAERRCVGVARHGRQEQGRDDGEQRNGDSATESQHASP